MKRYYFELLDENFTSLGANIADGSNKNTALNAAKRFMKANGIIYAQLQVNSILTENILDIIDIDLTEEAASAQPQAEQEAAAEPTATDFARRLDNATSNEEYAAALADLRADIKKLDEKVEASNTALEDFQKKFARRLAKIRAAIEAEEAEIAAEEAASAERDAKRAEEDARAAEQAAKFVEGLQRTVEEISQKLVNQAKPKAQADQPEAPEQVASKLQATDKPQAATTYRINIVDGCTNYETQEISISGITDLWQAKNRARAMMVQIAALTGFDLTTDIYGYIAADRSGDNVYVARIFNEQTNEFIEL